MKSFLIILPVFVLSACSYVVNVQSPISQPPAIEKTFFAVGVSYQEGLRNHHCSASKGYLAESWEIHLGPSSMEMFDLIFDALFEHMVVVDSVAAAIHSGLKNVIEVRLKSYNGCQVGWPIFGSTIGIEYEATLYDDGANIITKWEGSGSSLPGDIHEGCGTVDFSYEFFESRYLAIATCTAMRTAAADFIVNFQENPEIKDYLRK